jgi:hypothetical protein
VTGLGQIDLGAVGGPLEVILAARGLGNLVELGLDEGGLEIRINWDGVLDLVHHNSDVHLVQVSDDLSVGNNSCIKDGVLILEDSRALLQGVSSSIDMLDLLDGFLDGLHLVVGIDFSTEGLAIKLDGDVNVLHVGNHSGVVPDARLVDGFLVI